MNWYKKAQNIQEIIKNPGAAYWYAKNTLKGRFIPGEDVISKSPIWSFHYAHKVLKGRFELGEEAISKSARMSYWYAGMVLKNRFPWGEEAISKKPRYARDYFKRFPKPIRATEEDFLRDITK